MNIPAIQGTIKRRFLINYRVDPDVLAKILPKPFKPKVQNGFGIGGICLIRLENVRPKSIPLQYGLNSENAAHRIAVTWDGQEGVYIPRRDTDSLINHFVGGRLFPGVHHLAKFNVTESASRYEFSMVSRDGSVGISFQGREADGILGGSCFASLEEASKYFERGSMGYSESRREHVFDGLELRIRRWSIKALDVVRVHSSYFEDESFFPPGSVEFDSGFIMTNIPHEWHSLPRLFTAEGAPEAALSTLRKQ